VRRFDAKLRDRLAAAFNAADGDRLKDLWDQSEPFSVPESKG
jgi:hypothetical protein